MIKQMERRYDLEFFDGDGKPDKSTRSKKRRVKQTLRKLDLSKDVEDEYYDDLFGF